MLDEFGPVGEQRTIVGRGRGRGYSLACGPVDGVKLQVGNGEP